MLALDVAQPMMTRFSSHLTVGDWRTTGTYTHSSDTVSLWLWSSVAYA